MSVRCKDCPGPAFGLCCRGAAHQMLDGYTGSVLTSDEHGHCLHINYESREQADRAQEWLAGDAAPLPASDEVLEKRLRSLRVLLGVDSPETRGWAPAVRMEAQRTIDAALRSLRPPALPAAGEPTDSQMLEQAAAWLDEAADDITDWAGYASDYFQEKHNLARDVAEVRERATYLRSLRGDKR